MGKSYPIFLVLFFLFSLQGKVFSEGTSKFNIGLNLLLEDYHHAIDGKNIGIVTNQTEMNPGVKNLLHVLKDYPTISLKAIYIPEQGLDVASYTHPTLNIPVYILDGQTRMPTEEMLQEVDVLIFEPQAIGTGTNAYISTLNDCMMAAKQNNTSIIVLDSPRLLYGEALDRIVGPMEQGMKIGELAQYLNRDLGVDLTVIPVEPQWREVQLEGGLLIGDKSYVPLKSVLHEFGYQVGWDSVTKKVYAEKPGKMIAIETMMAPIKVWVNGTEVKSKDVVPIIKEGATYIPAQFIPWIEISQQKTIGNEIRMEAKDLSIAVNISMKIPGKQPPKKASGKMAYLTFDDGPSTLTPQVLDILKENGVKATFFVIGRNIKGHESVLKRAVAEGHTIGGHSYSHNYDLIYHDVDSFFKDIERGQKTIEQVTGKEMDVFRFPGGSNNSVSKKAQDPKVYSQGKWIMNDLTKEAAKKGYHYYDWNVSIGDASAQGYTAESALKKVREGIRNKKEVVILSHDSTPKVNTVKALPSIIKLLKDEGYSFGTLSPSVEGFVFLQ